MTFPRYLPIFNPAKALELPGGPGRLIPMEGLRGLAVFLVFIQHYFTFGIPFVGNFDILMNFNNKLKIYGNLGVDLFFILSGYLIYGGLLRRRQRFLKFMRRRYERLYPAFLAVVAPLVMAHLYFNTHKIPTGFISGFWYIILNILMLPGLFPIEPLHGVTWSLSYEMFFYIVLGLGVNFIDLGSWAGRSRIILILGLALLLCVLTMALGVGGENWGMPIRMVAFFAGMLLIELETLRMEYPPVWLIVLFWALLALLQSNITMPLYIGFPLNAIVFGLVCGKCFHNDNAFSDVFSWRPIRWLGNMSYSYYLVHGPVVLGFFAVCSAVGIKVISSAMLWCIMPLAFALTLAPAFVLFVLIERPLSLVPRTHA